MTIRNHNVWACKQSPLQFSLSLSPNNICKQTDRLRNLNAPKVYKTNAGRFKKLKSCVRSLRAIMVSVHRGPPALLLYVCIRGACVRRAAGQKREGHSGATPDFSAPQRSSAIISRRALGLSSASRPCTAEKSRSVQTYTRVCIRVTNPYSAVRARVRLCDCVVDK